MTTITSRKEDAIVKSADKPFGGSALKLEAKVHVAIEEFLGDEKKLFELTEAIGSPLNILFPQLIKDNVQSFQSCLRKHGLRSRVFFAHKANSSDCLPRQLALDDAYIDVSSANELRHALGCGFAAHRIQATGPKNTEFLALSLMHGIILSVDSVWELSEILRLRGQLKTTAKTPLLLRVSGFRSAHSQYRSKASRFGIPLDEVETAFECLEANCSELKLLGFAFHIDTVSIPEKAMAIENCLQLFDEAFDRGLEPTVLNLGGGFKVNYLANEEDWHNYTTAIREAVLGSRAPITWQGNSFGLMADKGSLRGSFNTYSYYDSLTGPRFLDELLGQQFVNLGDARVGAYIRDNGIELWIEPGRALLDQTGITVARVNSIRRSSQGDLLVCLNMKRQDLCFLDQEIFVDPLIVYRDAPKEGADAPIPVYFAGNLCLESDLICRHQTFVRSLPKPGDLVVFANTAGYFMDFSASKSIMQPTAEKIAVFKRDGQFCWTLDNQYQPLLSSSGAEK